MLKPRHLICVLILSLSCNLVADSVTNVVPAVQKWTPTGGSLNTAASNIIVDGKFVTKLKDVAKVFQQDLNAIRPESGKAKVTIGTPLAGHFFLTLTSPDRNGNEAYWVESGTTVTLKGASPHAVFWATRTVLQILIQDKNKRRLPKGTILDYPNYRGRMLMLNVGRTFYPFEVLKDCIRYMAWYKMNELQLRINDVARGDYAAFRIESKIFPKLTAKDGHYTQKQIRELQDFANVRGIIITPEISSPGHAGCFTRVDPSLQRKGLGVQYLDVLNPKAYRFMEKLFDEFIPMFDAPDVHIGTDEYPITKKNREDHIQIGEAFRNYINHFNNYIRKKGKNVRIGSGYEHMGGTTQPAASVIIDMRASGDAISKPKAGYEFINSTPGRMYRVPGDPDSGVSNAGIYNNWLPYILDKPEHNVKPNDPRLIGGKLNVWNDRNPTGYTMVEMAELTATSIRSFSEKVWGTKGSTDYTEFLKRAALIDNVPGVDVFTRPAAKDKK